MSTRETWAVAVLSMGVVVAALDDFASREEADDFARYHLRQCEARRAAGHPVARGLTTRVYQPVRPGAAPLGVAGDAR